MTDIEKRLQNTERALIALWSLMKDTMPPAYQEDIDRMVNEYFDANSALGSDFDLSNGFSPPIESKEEL